MADKLTSLTGFGEGDPKPEKVSAISKTRSSGQKMKALGYSHSDRKALTKVGYDIRKNSKSSALHKKMGKKVPGLKKVEGLKDAAGHQIYRK